LLINRQFTKMTFAGILCLTGANGGQSGRRNSRLALEWVSREANQRWRKTLS
jgi:hypothetical protein